MKQKDKISKVIELLSSNDALCSCDACNERNTSEWKCYSCGYIGTFKSLKCICPTKKNEPCKTYACQHMKIIVCPFCQDGERQVEDMAKLVIEALKILGL